MQNILLEEDPQIPHQINACKSSTNSLIMLLANWLFKEQPYSCCLWDRELVGLAESVVADLFLLLVYFALFVKNWTDFT